MHYKLEKEHCRVYNILFDRKGVLKDGNKLALMNFLFPHLEVIGFHLDAWNKVCG